jgi:hypothetical protein
MGSFHLLSLTWSRGGGERDAIECRSRNPQPTESFHSIEIQTDSERKKKKKKKKYEKDKKKSL